jgi:multicomponent Na+:H+ antiporter subunit B
MTSETSKKETLPSLSIIMATGARYMLPLLLLLSVFLLLRGHYNPGGGFVGGLAASAAFTVFVIAYDVERARIVLGVSPRTLIGGGLLVALSSGFFGLVIGKPFLTGLWLPFDIPAIGSVGTPLMFDLGVYLVVIGVVLMIVFSLAEE